MQAWCTGGHCPVWKMGHVNKRPSDRRGLIGWTRCMSEGLNGMGPEHTSRNQESPWETNEMRRRQGQTGKEEGDRGPTLWKSKWKHRGWQGARGSPKPGWTNNLTSSSSLFPTTSSGSCPQQSSAHSYYDRHLKAQLLSPSTKKSGVPRCLTSQVQAPESHTVSTQCVWLCVVTSIRPVWFEGSRRQKPILLIFLLFWYVTALTSILGIVQVQNIFIK